MKKVKVTHEDAKAVQFYLEEASQHSLAVEVVCYALKYMKEDPSISIVEAVALASSEWLK